LARSGRLKDTDVRKFISIAAVALVLVGLAWRFAGWIGRLLGMGGLGSSYEAFVEGYARILMAEGSFAKIFGPWLLMGAGLIILAALYLLDRKHTEVR
jgi:hypothetical protein